MSVKTNTAAASKSLKSGLSTFNASVLDQAKAGLKVGTALESVALFMLSTYGVAFCTEKSSNAGKMFSTAWDDNYKELVSKAPPEMALTIANQKGVYKGRLLRAACLAAIAQGKTMTPDQREEADRLIEKYDSNKSRKTGKIEARGYKRRMADDMSGLYKFHMSASNFDGLSDTKVANIGLALEQVLRLVGVDPASVVEKAQTKAA